MINALLYDGLDSYSHELLTILKNKNRKDNYKSLALTQVEIDNYKKTIFIVEDEEDLKLFYKLYYQLKHIVLHEFNGEFSKKISSIYKLVKLNSAFEKPKKNLIYSTLKKTKPTYKSTKIKTKTMFETASV